MKPEFEELLVVMGHKNDEEGNLSTDAISRLEIAREFIKNCSNQDHLAIIFTGGDGKYFNTSNTPHGRLMSSSMSKSGIGDVINLGHVNSCGTIEDALGIMRIVRECPHSVSKIYIVTSAYHMPRVQYIFKRFFPHKSLTFLSDDLPGTIDQKTHEKKALRELASTFPKFGWPAKDLDNVPALLGDEIRHYDNLSHLVLVASFSLVFFWLTSFSVDGTFFEGVLSVTPFWVISGLFLTIYWRLAGTAASVRRTQMQVSFLLGHPHLGSSRNLSAEHTSKVTSVVLVSWTLSWLSAFFISIFGA